MFPRAITITRIRGVTVRVDPSWIVIALLVIWSFYRQFDGGHASTTALAMAVATGLLFFVSVLVHELAHAFETQHRDITVAGITLFMLGGVTETHPEAERPRDEFVMAAVGPYASLVTAAVFGLIATGTDLYLADRLAVVAEVAGTLGWINLGLAVFNMLPASPLDGGRVLRSFVWAVTRNRDLAIRVTAWLGISAAAAGMAWALWSVSQGRIGNLWLALIAWFTFNASRAELRNAQARRQLRGRTVQSLLPPPVPAVPHDLPLEHAGIRLGQLPPEFAVPVEREGRTVGFVRPSAIEAVDPADRVFRMVEDVITPIHDLPQVEAAAQLLDVVELFRTHPELLVVSRGEPVAVLSLRQLDAALRVAETGAPA